MTDEEVMGILLEIKDKMKSDLNNFESVVDIDRKFDYLFSEGYFEVLKNIVEDVV